jgi:hypothetical protein
LKTEYWRAFGPAFFYRRQSILVWLLNAPLLGRWFRYVLRIGGVSSSVGRERIVAILPHAIFWGNAKRAHAEFRTHWKYAKRIYYAFRPVWWAMHLWDSLVADRFVPSLSFGFDTLTEYPEGGDSTMDCTNYRYDAALSVSWSVLRGATLTDVAGADDTTSDWCCGGYCSNTTDEFNSLQRSGYLFDTSPLGSGATITAAVFSVYGNLKENDSSYTPVAQLYLYNPASNTAYTQADWNEYGTTAQADTGVAYSAFSASAYNDITLNSTGRGNISKTGVTKFGIRDATYDVANSAWSWSDGLGWYMQVYYADQTGTANDPKIYVTYTPATPPAGAVIIISKNLPALLVAGALMRNETMSRRRFFNPVTWLRGGDN